MEREFLGIGGKDFLVKEEEAKDAAFVGSSSLQWPFSNKITSLQQFMSYRQENKQKKVVYDQLSSSGFQPTSTVDALDNNYRCSSALLSQKSFSADRHGGIHQFSHPAYTSQGTDSFGSSAHQSIEARMFTSIPHHSIPIATTSPFFKIYGSPSGPNHMVSSSKQQSPFGGGIAVTNSSVGTPGGAFAPRNIAKPSATTAQLTIFYAGAVNVYDDVSLEKAQAIMFLAGNGTNMAAAGSDRAEAPVLASTNVVGVEALSIKQTQSQTNGTSSPISVTSHSVSHSTNDDMMVAKTNGPLVHTSHHEPSKTTTTPVSSAAGAALMPGAVPQARKASLARFLEKRKERVTNAAPYASSQKLPENAVGFDGINLSANSTTAKVPLSSSREESWCLGMAKTSSADGSKFLNTKLEM